MPLKSIRSAADLAINGAAPAFDSPLHVGRPTVGDRAAFMARVGEMFDRGWLTNSGPLVNELEDALAARLGVKHCVAMTNGTVALEIAIRALGLEGEVIVPSYTFVATAHALSWQGITPVFADIDPVTHNLDPEAVARMITPRTTGIIGVHLWGRPADTAGLAEVAESNDLTVLYDAAHAFGCTSWGRPIGSFGAAEVFSFHATKAFNTFEGGAVTTNDDDLAETMRLMRNFGFAGVDTVIHPGTNGKMTEICAAMGLTNLDSLEQVFDANHANYDRYLAALADCGGVQLLTYDAEATNNYHYIVAEVADEGVRDRVVAALQAEGVLARKYFWPGCHRMEPYAALQPHAGLMLPVTERVSARVVVLPNGSDVGQEEVDVIAAVIRTVIHG
jgi:dTDP-4-amino-4,6-dideoxygalactose transaminase